MSHQCSYYIDALKGWTLTWCSHEYVSVHLHDKTDWSVNTETLCNKG